MAFITLCGITVAAQMNSGDRDMIEIGEGLERAFDGSLQRSARAYKREWSLTTIPDVPTVSRALKKLLQGRVRHWNFDADLYSDLGLGPSASTGASSVAGGLVGNALQLAASTGSVTYAGLGGVVGVDGFTLLIQRQEAGVWHDYHIAFDPNGALTDVWKDGVQQATALPTWISTYTHSTGTLILSNTTGAAQLYDELVTFAFQAPLASWSAQLAPWRSAPNAWPQTPGLTLGGTMDAGVVQGKPGKAKMQYAVINGSAYENSETFPFDLWEA